MRACLVKLDAIASDGFGSETGTSHHQTLQQLAGPLLGTLQPTECGTCQGCTLKTFPILVALYLVALCVNSDIKCYFCTKSS